MEIQSFYWDRVQTSRHAIAYTEHDFRTDTACYDLIIQWKTYVIDMYDEYMGFVSVGFFDL